MVKIALTGGIGTGKTYLSKHFREMGIPVFYADDEAKKLYRDDKFLEDMRREFSVYPIWREDGELDMTAMRASFADKAFMRKLSAFVHPYVMRKFAEWSAEQTSESVMMESAIIFEYGLEKYFDKIIVADAPEHLRIQRVKNRNPELTDEQIRHRMEQQLPQEVKCTRADLVVCTGETYKLSIERQ